MSLMLASGATAVASNPAAIVAWTAPTTYNKSGSPNINQNARFSVARDGQVYEFFGTPVGTWILPNSAGIGDDYEGKYRLISSSTSGTSGESFTVDADVSNTWLSILEGTGPSTRYPGIVYVTPAGQSGSATATIEVQIRRKSDNTVLLTQNIVCNVTVTA